MKAFVTGGAGFIGRRVIYKLIERGYSVDALVRSSASAETVRFLGANPVWGDVSDEASLRTPSVQASIQSSDVLFHIAAWYKLGDGDPRTASRINVDGTRHILTLAHELGVPRCVYTSSVAVFGDTHGEVADETYLRPDEPFLTEYDRTKWLAHYQVVLPLIQQGAPITLVMPSAVFGPRDTSLVGELMRQFYQEHLPVLPGPELTLAYVYVDDVAEGHILAAEKGQAGESYILAGPVYPLGEMVRMWSAITGKPIPLVSLPARLIKPLAPLAGLLNRVLPMPAMFSQDAAMLVEATYIASAAKAAEQLGWQPRPLTDGLKATFDWLAQEEARPRLPAVTQAQRRRVAAGVATAAGVLLLCGWFLNRRK